jgi:hypothetical protein
VSNSDESLQRYVKQYETSRGRPLYRWRYAGVEVEANTKSEARSILRRQLGGKLPAGAKVMLVGGV